jgi:SAM-dependent methyltransferase
MTATRDRLVATLHNGRDPFVGFPEGVYETDPQGWRSEHPYLIDTIEAARPSLIVEVGVWKGGSTIYMADKVKSLGLDCAIVSIDTFLGAWEHWINEEWRDSLKQKYGYPSLYYTFAANVIARGVSDYVVPLPIDSNNAAEVVRHYGFAPDIVHIDAGHDRKAVLSDLELWWKLLAPGGYLIGDDYDPNLQVWPEVAQAFHEFFGTDRIENFDGKCRIRKMVGKL